MIDIGCHLSVTEGYAAMASRMLRFGGTTFAFFTRPPRGGRAKEIRPEDADSMNRIVREAGFGKLVAHGSYTMKLCGAKAETRANALDMLCQDLERMEAFPGNYYNFHPGSHVGAGTAAAIPMIADALNQAMWPEIRSTILLETMSGKGSEVGATFEELREIIDRVAFPERVGVCLDTCHIWDAGYDIAGDPDGVLQHFDEVIGLDKLAAVHLNDSKNPCGSKKDRHEKLGEGQIGMEALRRFVTHPLLAGRPFILETPNDDEGYIREIAIVKSWEDPDR